MVLREELFLHKLVFYNKTDALRNAVENCTQETLDIQDKHGNTALHLACILGRTEAIRILTSKGASVRVHNAIKCTPIHEAVSYGKRENIKLVCEAASQQMKQLSATCNEKLSKTFESLPDFTCEIIWEFRTWVPFLSRLLPSDVCKVSKKGCKIRVDSSLTDLSSLAMPFSLDKNSKDSISLIVDTEDRDIKTFMVEHKTKSFKILKPWIDDEKVTDADINLLLSNELISVRFDFSKVNIEPCFSGIFNKQRKTATIDGLACDCITASDIHMYSFVRSEHLSTDILKRREMIRQKFQESCFQTNLEDIHEMNQAEFVEDLDPPPEPRCTFKDYLNAPSSALPIGRTLKIKGLQKNFSINVTLAKKFEIPVSDFVKVLECFVTLKQFKRLKEFIELVSSDGFPLKIEVPVLPSIKATVTIQKFNLNGAIADELFSIPSDYVQTLLTE